jgi:MYXO-CTERM domain-containing protein
MEWMGEQGMTELEYLEELTSPAAIVIEDLSSEGEGVILADYRGVAAEAADEFQRGCACATSMADGGSSRTSLASALVLLAGLVVRRRRQD